MQAKPHRVEVRTAKRARLYLVAGLASFAFLAAPIPSGAAAASSLSGQLWFGAEGATGTNPNGQSDNQVGHINSDATARNPADIITEDGSPGVQAVGLDTAAGLYFALMADGRLVSGHITNDLETTEASQVSQTVNSHTGGDIQTQYEPGPGSDDEVNTFAVDPVHHIIYLDLFGQTDDNTAIIKITYDPTTGIMSSPYDSSTGTLTAGSTLISNTSTSGTLVDATAMHYDIASGKLYYIDDDLGYQFNGGANQTWRQSEGIYVVDTTSGSPTATLLSSQAQFPPGPTSSEPYMAGMAVDAEKGIIYFTTNNVSSHTTTIWWMPITGGTATAMSLPTGVTLEFTYYFANGSDSMTLDDNHQDLYITDGGSATGDANTGNIIRLTLSADGHSFLAVGASGSNTAASFMKLDTANTSAATGALLFENLPTLSTLSATTTHAVEQSTAVTLLTATPTITDPDNTNLASATVAITDGTFNSNENSTADDHLSVNGQSSGLIAGTNITVTWTAGTETLTLTGDDTITNYDTVLSQVQYNTTGDNPTNYDNNTSRTITWQVNDGAAGNPVGPNTQTTSLNIDAVNDAPVATAPATHYTAIVQTDLSLKNASLQVSDVDGGVAGQSETATLSVGEGIITIAAGNSGVTGIANNGTSSVSFSGTIVQINALLGTGGTGTVIYNDNADPPSPSTTLTLLINDNGNTGSGGAQTATATDTIDVHEPPSITSADNATFTVGSNGSFTVTKKGIPTPTLNESGALPSGVTFDTGTGILSGTPAAGTGGTYPITFTASNGVGSDATQNFTLTVNEAPSITSVNSTTFTQGSAGTFTVTTGSHFPATETVSESGALPSGVTFVDNGNGTATLSGTPGTGTGGSYPITVTASNGVAPNATQSFTLTVKQPPAITSVNATTFVVGTAGSFTVTTTGTLPMTLGESGALPSGVSFLDNGDGTGTLHGTPTVSGTFPITFTASNGVAPDANQSFTLTVNKAPIITSTNSTTFTVGSAGTFTVTTGSHFPAAETISETGALPGGVTLVDNGNGTATLSGTPVAGSGGTYPLTIKASNGVNPDAAQSFTLTVNQPPAITSANNTTFQTSNPGTFSVTTTGFPTGASMVISESGGLPGGVTFTNNNNGTATLAGTPNAGTGGTYPITIRATNGVAPNAMQSFTLTVTQPSAITSGNSTTFTVGTLGTFNVTATGFPSPNVTLMSGSLPGGVNFAPGSGSGTLSGTPNAGTGGIYNLVFKADSGAAGNVTQNFTLTVDQAPTFTSATSTTFDVGSAGSLAVTATGFPNPNITLTTGSLPNGVSFTPGTGSATLSGTPASGSDGTYPLVFTANGGAAGSVTQNFTLTVNAAGTPTPCTPPAGMVAWWPGDGNADDIEGGHDGTLVGGATVTSPGKVAQSFSFDGNSDYVFVSDSPSLNPSTQITVDTWVKTSNAAAFQGLVSKFNHTNGNATDDSYNLSIESGGTVRWQIVTSANSAGYIVNSPASIADNQWHHLAGTYDGTTVSLFVDGASVASISGSGTIASSTTPLYLGAALINNSTTAFLNGQLDEVEIFKRALVPTEIADIYNAGSAGRCHCTPPPPNMISWWPGEGDGTDIQGGNTLLAGNGNGFGFAAGEVGQGFTFNGSQFLTAGTPSNLAITGSAVTIDGWIYPNNDSNSQIYFGKTALGQNDYLVYLNTGRLSSLIKTGGAETEVFGFADYPSNTTYFIPPVGKWTHIALTYDGTKIKLYANGSQVGQASKTGNIDGDNVPFNIGGRSGEDFFNGLIDEVEVFNRALTGAEIQAIYRAGSSGKCKSCTTYSASFTQGQAASAQAAQDWVNFRSFLVPAHYDTVTISGTFDLAGRTLTDATIVPQIAAALKDGIDFSVTAGGFTWNVGSCDGTELNANSAGDTSVCQCPDPGYVVRPNVGGGSPNWGGANTATCSGPSQTITVSFCKSSSLTPSVRQLANISSRASVGTGDNVAIAGFIIHSDPAKPGQTNGGAVPTKRVIIRGLGPSLEVNGTPMAGRLADPMLELHGGDGTLLEANDNWGDAVNASDIQATGLAPSNPNESAILVTLNSNNDYTAILRGAGNTTGIGLVEVFDLDVTSDTHLVNISTRGFVSTGNDVLIGGLIIQGSTPARFVLRAIGPSLTALGVANALQDPVLELHDTNGALIASNDDWTSSPDSAAIIATGLNPSNSKESAILLVPAPGGYTAIVRGNGPTPTGVGLVEAYRLEN